MKKISLLQLRENHKNNEYFGRLHLNFDNPDNIDTTTYSQSIRNVPEDITQESIEYLVTSIKTHWIPFLEHIGLQKKNIPAFSFPLGGIEFHPHKSEYDIYDDKVFVKGKILKYLVHNVIHEIIHTQSNPEITINKYSIEGRAGFYESTKSDSQYYGHILNEGTTEWLTIKFLKYLKEHTDINSIFSTIEIPTETSYHYMLYSVAINKIIQSQKNEFLSAFFQQKKTIGIEIARKYIPKNIENELVNIQKNAFGLWNIMKNTFGLSGILLGAQVLEISPLNSIDSIGISFVSVVIYKKIQELQTKKRASLLSSKISAL